MNNQEKDSKSRQKNTNRRVSLKKAADLKSTRLLKKIIGTYYKYSKHPANNHLIKVNNKNTRRRYEICSKLTIKNQNDVNDVALVFLLLTVNIFHTFF